MGSSAMQNELYSTLCIAMQLQCIVEPFKKKIVKRMEPQKTITCMVRYLQHAGINIDHFIRIA